VVYRPDPEGDEVIGSGTICGTARESGASEARADASR
jgi:tRNA-uridine 2-sulfurtransferase